MTLLVDASGHLTPTDPRSGLAVGRIAHVCHERTIDVALAELGVPGLDRATLEPILTYCAQLRCETDGATCPGCKRRTEADGIDSLDTFIARHREIIVGDGSVRLMGQGAGTLTTPGLEALAKTWSGENYWFWARRVLRKLRYGIRRAHIQGAPFAADGETPSIILMEPQLPDNIGMVARACANFGLDQLRLVAPRDGWPNEKARIAASGANYVIDDAVAYETLPAAVADLTWVCATTARQRDLAKPVLTPAEAIAELATRIAAGQRCAILFGPERTGLEQSEIAAADALVMAPVNPNFASLNLAQAVLLLAYEWMRQTGGGTLGRVTTYERPIASGPRLRGALPATKEQMFAFFEHLETELDRMGFLHPPAKRPTMVQNLRSMFTRIGATEQEIRTLRGIVKALVHGKGPGRRLP